jgi:hypothetical protein
MPSNNSTARRLARIARFDARREEAARRDADRERAERDLLRETEEILEAADVRISEEMSAPLYVTAARNANRHHCPNQGNCILTAQACSALNQNMPPHLITGQIIS